MPEVEFKKNKQLVKELCLDRYNCEILRFFARHPYARFDKQVLIGGLGLSDARRLEKSLKQLAEEKLLEMKGEHGAPLYWLTRHEPAHSAIKAVFTPKTHEADDSTDRLGMMQLIMPLAPCPAMVASAQ
jgi:hypothetical protein